MSDVASAEQMLSPEVSQSSGPKRRWTQHFSNMFKHTSLWMVMADPSLKWTAGEVRRVVAPAWGILAGSSLFTANMAAAAGVALRLDLPQAILVGGSFGLIYAGVDRAIVGYEALAKADRVVGTFMPRDPNRLTNGLNQLKSTAAHFLPTFLRVGIALGGSLLVAENTDRMVFHKEIASTLARDTLRDNLPRQTVAEQKKADYDDQTDEARDQVTNLKTLLDKAIADLNTANATTVSRSHSDLDLELKTAQEKLDQARTLADTLETKVACEEQGGKKISECTGVPGKGPNYKTDVILLKNAKEAVVNDEAAIAAVKERIVNAETIANQDADTESQRVSILEHTIADLKTQHEQAQSNLDQRIASRTAVRQAYDDEVKTGAGYHEQESGLAAEMHALEEYMWDPNNGDFPKTIVALLTLVFFGIEMSGILLQLGRSPVTTELVDAVDRKIAHIELAQKIRERTTGNPSERVDFDASMRAMAAAEVDPKRKALIEGVLDRRAASASAASPAEPVDTDREPSAPVNARSDASRVRQNPGAFDGAGAASTQAQPVAEPRSFRIRPATPPVGERSPTGFGDDETARASRAGRRSFTFGDPTIRQRGVDQAFAAPEAEITTPPPQTRTGSPRTPRVSPGGRRQFDTDTLGG